MTKLYLEIESSRNKIKDVEALMLKANNEFGLPEDEYNKMMTAVTEVVMNAIMHGNKENSKKKVKVFVEYNNDHMRIVVMDEGDGFEIKGLPDPTKSENIHDLHGRGVFIAKAMVDEFFYQHIDGNGSECVLIVRKK